MEGLRFQFKIPKLGLDPSIIKKIKEIINNVANELIEGKSAGEIVESEIKNQIKEAVLQQIEPMLGGNELLRKMADKIIDKAIDKIWNSIKKKYLSEGNKSKAALKTEAKTIGIARTDVKTFQISGLNNMGYYLAIISILLLYSTFPLIFIMGIGLAGYIPSIILYCAAFKLISKEWSNYPDPSEAEKKIKRIYGVFIFPQILLSFGILIMSIIFIPVIAIFLLIPLASIYISAKFTKDTLFKLQSSIKQPIPLSPQSSEISTGVALSISAKDRCPSCGMEVEDDMYFCPNCRRPLKDLFCPNCGKKLMPSWKACPYCGEEI